MSFSFKHLLLFACLGGGFAVCLRAGEPSTVSQQLPAPTPADAPRDRSLGETELLELLKARLQEDYVKDRGDLDLRLTRPWTSRTVPDEPLNVKVLEMPNNGVTPAFVLRFELFAGENSLGTYQTALRARIMREIWVAQSALKTGTLVADADIVRESRDVLPQRSPLAEFAEHDTTLELAEPLQAGSPLLARSVRVRPVVKRGQLADALVQDGALSVTMKVEVLEDGAPGQFVRARNLQTRRDLSGRVIDAQTIQIPL